MRRTSLILMTLVVTAACGSMGDLGGTLGDILGSSSPAETSDVRGTVSYVDTGARRIDLNVSYINDLRSTGDDQRGSIYYNNDTRVVFEGRDYEVADLERGDEIEVVGFNDNGRYVASTITVLRDVTR